MGQSHCNGVEYGIFEQALSRPVSLLYNLRLDGLTVCHDVEYEAERPDNVLLM